MKEQTIYALGFFDGVHIGHAALLKECRQLAQQCGCLSGAVTFAAHPDALVSGTAPALINTLEDRCMLMKAYVQQVICLPFDRQMQKMGYMTFFRRMIAQYGAAGFVCGADFRFGKNAEGNAALLRQACMEAGMPCTVVPQQKIDGMTVSSTVIRQFLEAGDLARAVRFLGHPHIFTGTVVPGHHLGRKLGIPTANLLPPPGLLHLKNGVYITRAVVDGRRWDAVTNVGSRPTVGGEGVTVESWLLDFQGDLYGRKITLEFYAYLRPEREFPDLPSLQGEIRKNALQAREYFQK